MTYSRKKYSSLMCKARWRRLRALVLGRHPLCTLCERAGRYVTATEVHHVIPLESVRDHARAEALCYDEGNLMPLCRACHIAVHRALGKNGRAERAERERVAVSGIVSSMTRPPGGVFSDGGAPPSEISCTSFGSMGENGKTPPGGGESGKQP